MHMFCCWAGPGFGESCWRRRAGGVMLRLVRMHPDQLAVPAVTARELVHGQFPQWRRLPVRAVRSSGTDHALFRIGGGLVARFPIRPGDPGTVRKGLEAGADAARTLAGRTRFATPVPVAIGEPGPGYPLPWAVQTWLPGVT